MDCRDAAQELAGAVFAEPEGDLAEHLAGCEACRTELEELRRTLGLFREMPEIDVGPEVFERIRARVRGEELRRNRLSRVYRLSVGGSVAAAVLLALLVIFLPGPDPVVARVTRSTDPGLLPGTGLRAGTEVAFAQPTEIRLLDGAGIARIRKGTRLVLDAPNRVRISEGEAFFDVRPGGKGGFHVYTDRFIVYVRGTRFGVRPDAVYVVRGSVNVEMDPSRVEPVGENERLVVDANGRWSRSSCTEEDIGWLLAYEPPTLRMELVETRPVRLDAPRSVRLRFTNPSLVAPIYLPPSLTDYLQMAVTPPGGRKPFHVRVARVRLLRRSEEEGRIRIDARSPLLVEVRLEAESFSVTRARGIHKVKFLYTVGDHGDPGLWGGSVETRPLEVEVIR